MEVQRNPYNFGLHLSRREVKTRDATVGGVLRWLSPFDDSSLLRLRILLGLQRTPILPPDLNGGQEDELTGAEQEKPSPQYARAASFWL